MKEKILEAAERRVRKAGFAEMSFRDLASDVGIKSASVHYHFPTKFDLGEALVEKYAKQFGARLSEIDIGDLQNALERFVGLYAEALVVDEAICLCAIMGAESIGLPQKVNQKTRAFFKMNADWLEDLFETHLADRKTDIVAMIVAALEGAIIVASVSRDRAVFDRVARAAIGSVRQ
ncbi:MAG: TetR/AcrR family transcriptional regulator [Pseudomonadota bacterium]